MDIGVLAPGGQAVHLTPVDCLIVVISESCHTLVVCKLDEEVGAGCRCAVVRQQSKEEGAQHIYFGGVAMFSMMLLDMLLPTLTACGLPARKSSRPLHSEVLSPSWASLRMSLLCVECLTAF